MALSSKKRIVLIVFEQEEEEEHRTGCIFVLSTSRIFIFYQRGRVDFWTSEELAVILVALFVNR